MKEKMIRNKHLYGDAEWPEWAVEAARQKHIGIRLGRIIKEYGFNKSAIRDGILSGKLSSKKLRCFGKKAENYLRETVGLQTIEDEQEKIVERCPCCGQVIRKRKNTVK